MGEMASDSTTEMTGTNRALNVARQNGRRPGQLLRKEKLPEEISFPLLTSPANGHPLSQATLPESTMGKLAYRHDARAHLMQVPQ